MSKILFNRTHMTGIGQRIILTLWVGGLWTMGYIVTPMLFQVLEDRRQAGEIAGQLFTAINYIGLVCGVLLLLGVLLQSAQHWWRSWQAWVLLGMLVLTSIIQFLITPMIQNLKASVPQGFIPGTSAAAQFGAMHGASSMVFLVISLLGLALVIFGVENRESE